MNVEDIRKYCLSFPDATEKLQWRDDLCFKVRGKIFAIVSLNTVPQKLCFKCLPERFSELIEQEDIHPAPYVGRYDWVMLDRLDALRPYQLRDLIRQSYEMKEAKAAKSKSAKKNLRTKKGNAARGTMHKKR
jgi:predicted DNA-binding protein (MmcQ/YjbR family)